MITVRFANGLCLQYNSAMWIERGGTMQTLRTAENGKFIANVPNDAVIEAVAPCRVYRAATDEPADRLTSLEREVASLKRAIKASLPKKEKRP